MLTVSYEIQDGFTLSLADLRRVLDDLRREQGRWWLDDLLILHLNGDVGRIEVFHSLAGPDQVTDEISFLVPVTPTDNLADEEHTMACLHPELIEPQTEGLYLEGDRVLMDFITDWDRFWNPLRRAIDQSNP
jgi:hypothetical protein